MRIKKTALAYKDGSFILSKQPIRVKQYGNLRKHTNKSWCDYLKSHKIFSKQMLFSIQWYWP